MSPTFWINVSFFLKAWGLCFLSSSQTIPINFSSNSFYSHQLPNQFPSNSFWFH
jgi:hypothetical protein